MCCVLCGVDCAALLCRLALVWRASDEAHEKFVDKDIPTMRATLASFQHLGVSSR